MSTHCYVQGYIAAAKAHKYLFVQQNTLLSLSELVGCPMGTRKLHVFSQEQLSVVGVVLADAEMVLIIHSALSSELIPQA